jgi:glycosyltransferase involved in cell wall biosynthesis
MFSRRVFELLACKTAVVSSRSVGIENLLGEHVRIVLNKQETSEEIARILSNNEERRRKNHLAYRHVMENHTYRHRFQEILDKLPIQKPLEKKKKISIVTITNRVEYIDNIIENMKRQKYRNIQLILVLNSNQFNLNEVKKRVSILDIDTQVYSKEESVSLGECFNFAYSKTDGDYIAKMDDDDLYGANYLSDSLLAFDYSGADIVGKKAIYVYFEGLDKTYMKYPGQEDIFTDFITGPTIIFRRSVMENIRFIDANKSEDSTFLKDAKEAGYKIFSSDAFNFVYMRRAVNNSHTWKMDVEQFLKTCDEVGTGVRVDEAFI